MHLGRLPKRTQTHPARSRETTKQQGRTSDRQNNPRCGIRSRCRLMSSMCRITPSSAQGPCNKTVQMVTARRPECLAVRAAITMVTTWTSASTRHGGLRDREPAVPRPGLIRRRRWEAQMQITWLLPEGHVWGSVGQHLCV